MRKLFVITLTSLFLLGCSNKHLDYSDFNDNHIAWYEIFTIDKKAYDIYFYSTSCLHCHSLKETVLDFANKHKNNFFFLKESSQYVYGKDIEKTIGVTSIEDFYVRGVPTLVHISFGIVSLHLLGEKEIKNYLKTFPF